MKGTLTPKHGIYKLFNEGNEYISTTEPRVFPTVCNLNCPVSVDYLQEQLTTLTMKWGCEDIPYCFYSIV